MIDLVNDDENRFFLCRFDRGLSYLVCVLRQSFEVFIEIKRSIRVNQIDPVGISVAVSSEIDSLDVFDNRASAERVQELLFERPMKLAIVRFSFIGKIDLDPCSF